MGKPNGAIWRAVRGNCSDGGATGGGFGLHAAPNKDHPIATVDVLKEADSILCPPPSSARSQHRPRHSSTRSVVCEPPVLWWAAGIFFSPGTQGGGQEISAFTALTLLAHQGLPYVPLYYRAPELFNTDEIHG
ncbi:hypothetical protein PF002_g28165 [Phytophthora fragariae]|uniref:Uncharacterized protein n=1 Tax=Phytophthora fragariae TaxID=53985 RepID=A0A6A3W2S2_9STRA|nr:hypothetical protein PF002_g28165 [Phytophthora fragariae]KAE9272318.1 hypothetical protein PF001_g27998 [Phytophthora fragariae]